MTADLQTSAPAINLSPPKVGAPGRDNTSQSTRSDSDSIDVPSAGIKFPPQAIGHTSAIPAPPAGTTSARSAIVVAPPKLDSPTGHPGSLNGPLPTAPHVTSAVEGQTSPAAKPDSKPVCTAQAGDPSSRTATAPSVPNAVAPSGAELPRAATELSIPLVVSPLAENNTPPATSRAMPMTPAPGAVGEGPQGSAELQATPKEVSLNLADPLLALAADVLDDLERVRIANENRLRQLTRDETDADGEERGFGLTLDHPDVARLATLVEGLGVAEKDATKNLQHRLKRHPLFPWLKGQKGVGDKQAARLLAAIGDPYWNTLHNRPRTVSELWAYAGYHVLSVGGQPTFAPHARRAADGADLPAGHGRSHAHLAPASGSKSGHPDQTSTDDHRPDVGVAPKRARGARANWSANAKMRAFLIAESCVKQLKKTCPVDVEVGYATHADGCECGGYRKVYDATREKYVDAVHLVECVRCGPKGKPAQPGSDLSRAHKQARALRAVAKELLKGLWREAKRLHEETGQ